ncbi:MAG: hypothetical protein AAF736_13190 [Pseudomonadota bacterium]
MNQSSTRPEAIRALLDAQLQLMQKQLRVVASRKGIPSSPAPSGTTAEVESDTPDPATRAPVLESPVQEFASDLTKAQLAWVDSLATRYGKRFSESKRLAAQNRVHLACVDGMAGMTALTKAMAFPLAFRQSKGVRLIDLNGNDLLALADAELTPAAALSIKIDGQDSQAREATGELPNSRSNPACGRLAGLVCELTDLDRCALFRSGEDALRESLRLASSSSGRNQFLVLGGSHAVQDNIGAENAGQASWSGQTNSLAAWVSELTGAGALPWGSPEALAQIQSARCSTVICADLPSLDGAAFSDDLLAVCREHQCVVVSVERAPRFSPTASGAESALSGADLRVFVDPVGPNLPLGVVAGAASLIDLLDGGNWDFEDESLPASSMTDGAGRRPVSSTSVAAACAALQALQTQQQNGQGTGGGLTTQLLDRVNTSLEGLGATLRMSSQGGLLSLTQNTRSPAVALLHRLLHLEGVYLPEDRPFSLTEQHSEEDLSKVAEALKRSAAELIQAGLLDGDPVAAKKQLSARDAIPPGARLGRNAAGEPAYFIEDPDKKGRYIEVGKP